MDKKFLEKHSEKEIRSVCDLFGMYESLYGKELQNFTKEEIMQMYRKQKIEKVTTYRIYNQIGRMYCQFVTGSPFPFEEVTIEDLRKCVTNKKEFVSREKLDEIERQTLNDIDRAVLELAWEGITNYSVVTSINIEMISTTDRVLHLDGREIALSSKLYLYLMGGIAQTDYQTYGQKCVTIEQNQQLYKPKFNARDPYTDTARKKWYMQLVKRISDYVGVKFTALDIRNSGLYYKLKGIQKEDNYSNIKDALRSAKGQILKKEYALSGDQALLMSLSNYQEAQEE